MYIADFFSRYKNHPVLFVGSGLSRRYLKCSDTWDGLLRKIVISYSDNEEHYYDLKGMCQVGHEYDYAALGSLIEKEFNEQASKDRNGKFKAINDLYYENMARNQQISRFKFLVSEYFKKLDYKDEIIEEIAELKKARKNVGSVITTNYDSLIEDIFGFAPLIGNDILLSNPYGSVYKIHGCASRPADIIITKEDYDEFDKRYELIRAQLLSLFIHNPIVFLGYSISDDDIKKILKTIFSYVNPNSDVSEKIRSNFLLIEYDNGSNNLDVVEHDIELGGEFGIIRINKLKTDNFIQVYKQIAELIIPISAMDVRKVQSVVKEIYAGGSIQVQITENIDDLRNSDKILAIGSSKTIKYTYITTSEMIEKYFDLMDESNVAIIQLINKQKIQTTQYFPIFGFSSICSNLDNVDILKKQQVEKVKDFLKGSCIEHDSKYHSIKDILEAVEIAASYKHHSIMCAVAKRSISLDELDYYLRNIDMAEKKKSDYRRLLCLYDILKYGDTEDIAKSVDVF